MEIVTFAATSVLLRVLLIDATTGQGKTALASNTSGLVISTIADVESTATAYTAAGGTIETIATLGTYTAPTAGKCRFKEVDATNHPGLYELHLANARFAVANARRLYVTFSGVSGVQQMTRMIELKRVDLQPASGFVASDLRAVSGSATLYNALVGLLGLFADTGALPSLPGYVGYDDGGSLTNGNRTYAFGGDAVADAMAANGGAAMLVGAYALFLQIGGGGAGWATLVESADPDARKVTFADAVPADLVSTVGGSTTTQGRMVFLRAPTSGLSLAPAYDPAKTAMQAGATVKATAPDGSALAKQSDVTDALTPARLGKLDSLTFTNPGVVDANASVSLSTGDKQDIVDGVVAGVNTSGTGDGDTEVDHNTGGTDNLRYVVSGVGVGDATVIAYLKADYDAGTYTRRGRTVTRSDGRWAKPLNLNSSLTYTIIFEKPDVYGPDAVEVTVP